MLGILHLKGVQKKDHLWPLTDSHTPTFLPIPHLPQIQLPTFLPTTGSTLYQYLLPIFSPCIPPLSKHTASSWLYANLHRAHRWSDTPNGGRPTLESSAGNFRSPNGLHSERAGSAGLGGHSLSNRCVVRQRRPGEGTLLSLERAGNPVCTISHLMLKPDVIIIDAGQLSLPSLLP